MVIEGQPRTYSPLLVMAGVVMSLLAAAPAARACDNEAPKLESLAITPTSIDVSSGNQTVTFRLRVTDTQHTDGCSGVSSIHIQLRSPGNEHGASAWSFRRISGDAYDGVYEQDVTVYRYMGPGTWKVMLVQLSDKSYNHVRYQNADLVAAGHSTTVEVASDPFDLTPPSVESLSFSSVADVRSGPATVSFRMRLTDDLVGVTNMTLALDSPTKGHTIYAHAYANHLVSGNGLDGIYEFQAVVPDTYEPGIYEMGYLQAGDYLGNTVRYSKWGAGFPSWMPTQLTVINDSPDLVDPQLLDLRIPNARIDCSWGEQLVPIEIRASDDNSGIYTLQVSLVSPSGKSAGAYGYVGNRVSGTALDGWYRLVVRIPSCSEEGCWRVARIGIGDNASNHPFFHQSDFTAAGFPTNLCNGFAAGSSRAVIRAPFAGKVLNGQRATVVARLAEGEPSTTRDVRFQYRPEGSGTWSDVTAANPNHANPDLGHPYFVHWSVGSLPEGNYDLRAVATSSGGVVDPNPEVIRVRIGRSSHDLEEDVDSLGRERQRVRLTYTNEGRAFLAGEQSAQRLGSVILPAYATSASELEVTTLPESVFSSAAFQGLRVVGGLEAKLSNGQSDLNGSTQAEVLLSYPDSDDDGILDGTGIPEENLSIYHYDPVTDTLTPLGGLARSRRANVVRAKTSHFSTFVLMQRVPTGRIEGVLTESATGNPMPGVTVRSEPLGIEVVTDAVGAYAFPVEPGSYRLSAGKSGYYRQTSPFASVVAGTPTQINLSLTPGTISGFGPVDVATLGGDVVTITGSGFTADVSVWLGSLQAAQVEVVSATTLRVTVPAQAGGVVDLRVELPGQHALVVEAALRYVVVAAAAPPPNSSPPVAPTSTSEPLASPDPPAPSAPPSTPSGPSVPTSAPASGGGGGGGGCQIAPIPPHASWPVLLLVVLCLGGLRRSEVSRPSGRHA